MYNYHKIDSIFLRNPETKFKTFLTGQYSRPEFELLKDLKWLGTEKVDGTNININIILGDNADELSFGLKGHTEKSDIPKFQMERLTEIVNALDFTVLFSSFKNNVTLHGELYGNKIQAVGKQYNSITQDFIVFDISSEKTFLEQDVVKEITAKLGLKYPEQYSVTLDEAIEMCKVRFKSKIDEKVEAEGLVLRPPIELKSNKGRIITKVKCKDFK